MVSPVHSERAARIEPSTSATRCGGGRRTAVSRWRSHSRASASASPANRNTTRSSLATPEWRVASRFAESRVLRGTLASFRLEKLGGGQASWLGAELAVLSQAIQRPLNYLASQPYTRLIGCQGFAWLPRRPTRVG